MDARHPWRLRLAARAPLLVLSVAAVASFGAVWHTLVQDFALSVPEAGLVAAAQATPLVAAVRWPLAAWTVSALAVSAATAVASTGVDGVWPDPNLYVHLGVMLVAGVRSRTEFLAVMWLALVVPSVARVAVDPATTGSPGLAETIGLATTVLIAAAAVRAREDAFRHLGEQQRITEGERVRVATLRERTRIARELHDVVAHHMSVIAVQAEAAPLRVSDPPDALRDAFAAIRRGAVAGLTELRRVVGVLRDTDDPVVPQPGLDHLEALVGNLRAAGLRVETSVDGTPRPLPPGLELSAVRIVQEALSNVVHHAPGAAARVCIIYTPNALKVAIINDPPTESPASHARGHGLVGMRERVAVFGGRLDAGPAGTGGYAVTAVLPTDDQEQS